MSATVLIAAAKTESRQELNDALLDTATRGELAAVEDLLRRGADPNTRRATDSATPLNRAVMEGNAQVVTKLLDYGADPRPDGYPVVDYAVYKKQERVARLLMSRGLDINEKDSTGTPTLARQLWGTPAQNPMSQVDDIAFLLKLGADPNAKTPGGVTALMMVAGRFAMSERAEESKAIHALMQLLIKSGARLNDQDSKGASALMHAMDGGTIVAIRALIEAGADINLQNENGYFPLLMALQRYDRDGRIDYLIEHGADLEKTNREGFTTLMAAAAAGYRNYVSLLIKRGVDPNARTTSGRTAVHWAAAYYNRRYDSLAEDGRNRREAVEILRLLMSSGGDLDATDNDGTTPLHSATMDGYVDAVRFLLEHGVDLNQANAKGETPLFLSIASDIDSFDKMKFLLTKGANVNLPGPNGQTPLMLASRLMMPGYVVYLLQRNANADARDGNGNTALSLVARAYGEQALKPRDYIAIIRALASASSSVDQRDATGMSPLMWTAISNLPEAMNAVLEKGADVDARSSDGRTALMWAASVNALDTMRVLISKGTDLRATDNTGRTALDWANWMNQKEAAELLKSVSHAP